MAKLRIEAGLQPRGASLRTIGRELKSMDERKVKGIFKDALEPAAAPFVRAVRASVLAIPVTGTKHTGLRARIALCAEAASWEPASPPRSVAVAVEMNPKRMPPDELSLPLGMEGAKRWRHPVYQTAKNPDTWVTQLPHPYFYQAASGFGRAGGEALKGALEDITRQLNG